MLTTVVDDQVGKTYGNLMVDVQTGSEKLKDRARRILDDRHRARATTRPRRCSSARSGTSRRRSSCRRPDLTLPQAMTRLRKANDSVARGDRRRHRAAAARAAAQRTASSAGRSLPPAELPPQRAPRPASARRRDAAAGTTPAASVVIGPLDHALDARAPSTVPVATSTIAPRLKDRRHPHRQRLARHAARDRRRTATRCCAASAACSVTRCVRASSSRAGSLKPMWPLVPMPRICRSMPPAAAIARS